MIIIISILVTTDHSVDIETAAICDLACPHCYREYILTPDKIMKFENYKKIIDEISELKVPSIKFNWRGEPLLHPKLPEFIKYAKMKGILETIINTNATHLNEKKSEELIEAGLDLIIYSFDGGSKKLMKKIDQEGLKKIILKMSIRILKIFIKLKKNYQVSFLIQKYK